MLWSRIWSSTVVLTIVHIAGCAEALKTMIRLSYKLALEENLHGMDKYAQHGCRSGAMGI